MFLSLLKAAELILTLWVSKEKDKYNSQVLELKRVWMAERQKPLGTRDNAKMDWARIELQGVVDALEKQILMQGK